MCWSWLVEVQAVNWSRPLPSLLSRQGKNIYLRAWRLGLHELRTRTEGAPNEAPGEPGAIYSSQNLSYITMHQMNCQLAPCGLPRSSRLSLEIAVRIAWLWYLPGTCLFLSPGKEHPFSIYACKYERSVIAMNPPAIAWREALNANCRCSFNRFKCCGMHHPDRRLWICYKNYVLIFSDLGENNQPTWVNLAHKNPFLLYNAASLESVERVKVHRR